jgi:steroid 5-alpha reductase family enzyme
LTLAHALHDLAIVWGAAAIAMTATWAIQWRTQNAGYVDVCWALCLGFAALYFGASADGAFLPRFLVAVLGAAWAFRLANHLLARVLTEGEDGRYAAVRRYFAGSQLKFFLFFQAQALLVVVFSIPFLAAAQNPVPGITPWLVAAVLVWIVSVAGEWLADRQLTRFRRNPKHRGKTCRAGLWRYSRHPNYFFEWLHWFSYVLLAVGSPHALWAWIGPALMLVCLCWVTGIPYTEQQALRSRGEDYREYQRTTSVLIPWFPKTEGRRGD